MLLEIKNAKNSSISPSLKQQLLHVDVEGLEVDDILVHIDIVTAIEYYGMTELLDTIGEEHLRSHLANL